MLGSRPEYAPIRLANPTSPEDNAAILAFYDQTAITGRAIQLRSVRAPDFFAFLKLQSEEFYVFLYEAAPGVISGLGVIVIRPGYWQGRIQKVAYLGDFRASLDRRLDLGPRGITKFR